MGIREEIKSYIVRSGMTMTEVVDRLYDDYDWSRSVPNLSGKLKRGSLRYGEAVELADALGYDIVQNSNATTLSEATGAEDVTADTFAALFIRRKKFREGAKFRTWLYTVARNRAIDWVRKNGRNRPLTGLENVLVSADGEEAMLGRQRKESLYACMQKLPATYKEVLYLSYFDGFSVKEICRILKKSAKQVYNLLSRAKTALKAILVKEGFSHENI